jgi:hypothetical protein
MLHRERLAVTRVEAPILVQMRSMWVPAVLGVMFRVRATWRLEAPRAMSVSTSTSRGVSPPGPPRRFLRSWPAAASTASTASPSTRRERTSLRSSFATVVAGMAGR